MREKPGVLDWLRLRRIPDFTRARWLGGLLGSLLLLTAFGILIGGLATLVQFLGTATGLLAVEDVSTRHEAIRNIGLVLAAVVGAPFVAWRSFVAAKQAGIAAESLFNDKINRAAEDLSARRQVTERATDPSGEVKVLTEWEDDRVKRAAGIERLEGLVEEQPDAAPRAARMLSIYARELSR